MPQDLPDSKIEWKYMIFPFFVWVGHVAAIVAALNGGSWRICGLIIAVAITCGIFCASAGE